MHLRSDKAAAGMVNESERLLAAAAVAIEWTGAEVERLTSKTAQRSARVKKTVNSMSQQSPKGQC